MQDKSTGDAKAKVGRRAMLVAVISGLLAAGLLAVYLDRYERETSGGERVQILRALKPIERGTLITRELLVEAAVPASYLEARAVRAVELGKVVGIRTATALDTQDALLWTDLAIAQEQRDLSSLIQPGSRALTIKATSGYQHEQSDLIRPGDYVDVIATMGQKGASSIDPKADMTSVVLLQRILVLAVGNETEVQAFRANDKDDKLCANNSTMLTLSLKVEEAQLLSLATQRGQLSVIVRPPNDTRIVEGAPDMPMSSLFDVKFRNDLQRRRSGSSSSPQRPVKIAGSE